MESTAARVLRDGNWNDRQLRTECVSEGVQHLIQIIKTAKKKIQLGVQYKSKTDRRYTNN